MDCSTFYGLKRGKEEDEPTRVSMEHCPEITKVLRPIYKKNGVELVHRSGNSLRQHLGSAKDKIPELHKSGIYEVKCQEGCPFRYLGRTVRRPVTRYGEHVDDWINEDANGSAVAAHLLKEGHEVNEDSLALLKPYSNAYKIDYMEAVYINKYKGQPLMNKVFGVTSPLLCLVDPIKTVDNATSGDKDEI